MIVRIEITGQSTAYKIQGGNIYVSLPYSFLHNWPSTQFI